MRLMTDLMKLNIENRDLNYEKEYYKRFVVYLDSALSNCLFGESEK